MVHEEEVILHQYQDHVHVHDHHIIVIILIEEIDIIVVIVEEDINDPDIDEVDHVHFHQIHPLIMIKKRKIMIKTMDLLFTVCVFILALYSLIISFFVS